MAKKVIKPEAAETTAKRGFKVVQMENVAAKDKDDIIFAEQGDPTYISHQVFPEGDGEFTLVFVYRTDG